MQWRSWQSPQFMCSWRTRCYICLKGSTSNKLRLSSLLHDLSPRMLEFLKDLEESAVQLDRMSKGAKISSIAGSSVGAVGGVLSIVGLALIPVTAGVSLALTMTGVGLGVTSGVNSAVTTATEIGVNCKHQKKASEVFQSFMEDVQSLQDCLKEVTSQPVTKIKISKIDVVVGVGKVLGKAGAIGKDIPDIGQAAVKGPLALSKSARAGFITLNALFLGMDIFFICKDSISLAKGSETEVSQFIRARAALWSSEMDSWKKIRDSLCQSLLTSEKNKFSDDHTV
uniref:Apolipoprotein L n=1 Tax=Lates calcarifer TaxID=8187 RepID=A0A4W6DZS3_LATCA